MKRFHGMNVMHAPLLAFALLVIACGGEKSVASKSAAAYREAQAKGTPIAGGHDHGHGAAAGTATAADHSAHGTTTDAHAGHDMTATGSAAADHSAHGATGADHAAMGHGTTASAHAGHTTRGATAVDHAAMGHGATASGAHGQHGTARSTSGDHTGHATVPRTGAHDQHAGMQHGATTAGTDPHAQHRQPASATPMDHSQHAATSPTPAAGADPHAQHRAGATPASPIAATPPRTNAEIRAINPTSTLQSDVFDAPAAVSVNEAAKARQGGGHEGHQMRGITPGEDRENPPTPMPATRDRTTAPAGDHSQHGGSQAAAVYTCPMHPEVTSNKPGTCPKCGMTLVKKN